MRPGGTRMDTRRLWIIMTVFGMLAAMAACNTNDGDGDGNEYGCVDVNPKDGYDDVTGKRCGTDQHDGDHDVDGSTDGNGDNFSIDCGTPPNNGYFVAVMSDMTDRQEVVYMKAGSDEEKVVQMKANQPVCIPVKPNEEPMIMSVLLKCGDSSQPCPDPLRPTPKLWVRTIPGRDIFFYFGNEVNANLHELPINPDMFVSAYSLGPLLQETNFLIYTQWPGP